MFSKILVANRGEVAVRVMRACKEMGITSVAVYSEADRNALHVSLADESICLGKAASKDSYLNKEAILSAALASKAQAIHPGYGFLSENADFVKLCEENGIYFIGPTSDLITKMGDKDSARKTMSDAGIPVIPGTEIVKTIQEGKIEADKIGYPLVIKARAGGGGKGIRLVNLPTEFEKAYNDAATEAENAFGDGALYIEKYLYPAKHIEVQILCDEHGNTISLGERECSIQRNKQKIIEEAPSPGVDDKLRKRMISISQKAVKAVGYINAGTIEFLMDQDQNFYFMEMNTRLQVEHPVTEMITGVDLVKWQIRITAGLPLAFSQSDIKIQGHSIECRINAEDPTKNYRPSCGKITFLHIPGGPGIRFDTALYQDYEVPPYYDSLIGKLIVFAQTREEAIRKMKASLCELIIEGISYNRDLHVELLSESEFISGEYMTDFMDKRE